MKKFIYAFGIMVFLSAQGAMAIENRGHKNHCKGISDERVKPVYKDQKDKDLSPVATKAE